MASHGNYRHARYNDDNCSEVVDVKITVR